MRRIVLLSSCEVEYIILATITCQGIWLVYLIEELVKVQLKSMKILVDNLSSIELARTPIFHNRSKPIDVKYHYVKVCVEEKKIILEHVASDKQSLDILTKLLRRVKFGKLRGKISIVDIRNQLQV